MAPQNTRANAVKNLPAGKVECPDCHNVYSFARGGIRKHRALKHQATVRSTGWKSIRVDGGVVERCSEDVSSLIQPKATLLNDEAKDIRESDTSESNDSHGQSVYSLRTKPNDWESESGDPLNQPPHYQFSNSLLPAVEFTPCDPLLNPPQSPNISSADEEELDRELRQGLGGHYFQVLHPDSTSYLSSSCSRPHILSKSPGAGSNINGSIPAFHPFKSEVDYEMASHVFFQGMTQRDITAHFRNLKKRGLPNFTLNSFKELRQTLKKDQMSVTAAFQSHIISAEFEGQTIQHRVYIRDPIDIMKEVIRDDATRQHMQFYPVKKFKGTDKQPFHKVRVYDELWTTKRWWKFQVNILARCFIIEGTEVENTQDSLPNHDGCVGAIILYSDGTSAVKFGQKTVHPIYMWLGNVPLRERSGNGKGGCQLIGFQPEADLAELLVVSTVAVFVLISFTSYILLLLFGVNSEFKCPICLAPKAHLHHLTKQFPKRSLQQAQRQLKQYQRTKDAEGMNIAVKELTSTSSLRPEKARRNPI
ncbi:hypothetical protein BT69DRAFT_1302742 [Atractiella rhizophila]|nr:hypothetical protein BT69DRAFT_1302742 [Atractiella rhizophila]